MRIITLLLIGLLIFPSFSFADGVSIKEAKRVAKNYYYQNTQNQQQKSYDNINLKINHIEFEENNLFYIFDLENSNGFVIVSAQDFTKPILGYSDKNNVDFSNLSPSLKYILDGYSRQIKKGIRVHAKATKKTQSKWQNLQIPRKNKTSIVDSEGPLLRTNWNQSPYYNDLCPTNSNGEHAVVGCVAVAMAQAMKYYNYPKQGQNSKSHNDNNGNVQQDSTIDYSKETYAWYNMPDALNGENNDLAKLMYHCGHAVNMNWEVESSGANTRWVVYSLQNLYNYDSAIDEYDRQDHEGNYNYTDEEWEKMIRDELDLLHPIVYSGYESSTWSGHAWNCDGYKYDNDNSCYLYHMNYGWGGSGNGYFTLDNLISGTTPEGDDDHFDVGHQIILHIYPNTDYPEHCSDNRIIDGFNGIFGDGSGNELYQNNQDCQTLIQPKCKTGKVTLTFNNFDLSIGDQINLYNGNSINDPLITTLDKNNLPSGQYTSNSGALLIQFITDNSENAQGWEAVYKTETCSYAKRTERGGVVEDGSGSCDYNPGEDCTYYIEPENQTRITLRFSEFNLDTPDKDYLKVYNADGTLLETFQQSNPPNGDFVVNSSKVRLRFRSYSDENIGTGWKLKYLSGEVDVNEIINFNELIKIYPNPFSSNAFIQVSNTNSKKVNITLTDIVGKTILKKALGNFTNTRTISLSEIGFTDVNKGMYLLNIQIGNQIKTYKLISE